MKKALLFVFALSLFIATTFLSPASAGDVSVQLEIPIPDIGQSLPVCTTRETNRACAGIEEYLSAIYRWLIGITAVLAVVALTWGGVRWLTSSGDKGVIQDAKKVIINAVIGILVALSSYSLLWAINPNLAQFEPLRITQYDQKR
ncbi:hypothetical protein HY623_04525 [Candidatus Uhrbacteria bacterium]|nr:hypothetical protein [Candidatus Uhrbacteria bacterium]